MKAERSNNFAILFDLDGTLIDSVYEHVIAWAASLRSVGIVNRSARHAPLSAIGVASHAM